MNNSASKRLLACYGHALSLHRSYSDAMQPAKVWAHFACCTQSIYPTHCVQSIAQHCKHKAVHSFKFLVQCWSTVSSCIKE